MMSAAPCKRSVDPVIAFVGCMVPDEPDFHGPAFNRAGQMFQQGLLDGLTAAGLGPDTILCFEPIPAFPRGRRLVGRFGTYTTRTGTSVNLLPFVNIHPFKWLTLGLAVLIALARWSWRCRGRRRIIYCVNLTMPPGLFTWIAARLTGAKAFVALLDVLKPGALVPDTMSWRFDFALQRWLIPRHDGVMVVSRAIGDDLAPGRRVCLVDGGVNPEAFAAAPARSERRGPAGVFRVVLTGSLERFNGVDMALEAMPYLPAGYELILAGSGSLADKVREVAARDPRVTYRGFLEFQQVLELYWSADLLLNLRLTRAVDTRYFFPSKLMEMLTSATPVLSTCTGHVEEEYGHVAYLLRDETPRALAERIVEIAQIPVDERRTLGRRARDFMFAEKTWQKQGQRLAHYIRTEVLA